MIFTATPAFAQKVGAGKADLSIVPAGWLSIARPETRAEPAFGEYVIGGIITFAPASWIGLEGELLAGLRRSQDLNFGSTRRSPQSLLRSSWMR